LLLISSLISDVDNCIILSPDLYGLTFKRIGQLLKLTMNGSVDDGVANNNLDSTDQLRINLDARFDFLTEFGFQTLDEFFDRAVRRLSCRGNLSFQHALIFGFQFLKGGSHLRQQGQAAIFDQKLNQIYTGLIKLFVTD